MTKLGLCCYLGGRSTDRFPSDILIQHAKTTCEKPGKTTYAAPGQPGNPQAEICRNVSVPKPCGRSSDHQKRNSEALSAIKNQDWRISGTPEQWKKEGVKGTASWENFCHLRGFLGPWLREDRWTGFDPSCGKTDTNLCGLPSMFSFCGKSSMRDSCSLVSRT